MSNTDMFFDSPSEQSKIKAKIVASYFTAWSRVMCNNWSSSSEIGYVDLFSGPGVYQDGSESVPLLLVKDVLNNPKLLNRIWFLFNDQSEDNINNLRQHIKNADINNKLDKRIHYSTKTVNEAFASDIRINSQGPILSFVDPFGYQGLTIDFISTLTNNNGPDCIFFFNYNRINMALSSNTKFDEYLGSIFGGTKVSSLKAELSGLPAEEREPIVLNALVASLKNNNANYVLPFKFYRTDMVRTSHFIIFVSKHKRGCSIMKQIMYANSAKDVDGVASFELHDIKNFGDKYEQLSFFDRPLDALRDEIYISYKGKTVCVKEICEKYDTDISNHFVSRNVRDALIRMEEAGQLVVESGRKQKSRNGKLNMPDKAIIRII